MIDEIEIQNTIEDLEGEVSSLEDELENMSRDLKFLEQKERLDGFLIDYIKDRKEQFEAMGDKHAVEIYKEILKEV